MNLDFERVIASVAEQGYFVGEGFWPDQDARALAAACRELAGEGRYRPARIGHGGAEARDEAVRSDLICWLDDDAPPLLKGYLEQLEQLRQCANRNLYLGLHDFEIHAAMYPPGAHYGRHLDRFRDDDARTLTAILYLNADWCPEDEGMLRVYLANGRELDVAPRLGTFVSFLSADLPHEVLPTRRDRLALTGWYRRRLGLPL